MLTLSGFYHAAGLPALRRRDGFKLRSGSLNVHSLLLSEHQRQSQQTHSGSMDLNLGSPQSVSRDKVGATSCSLEGVDILSHMLDTFFSVEEKEHLAVQGAAQYSSRTVARIDSERSNRHHHHHYLEHSEISSGLNSTCHTSAAAATSVAIVTDNCGVDDSFGSGSSSNRHYQHPRQYHHSMSPLAAASNAASGAASHRHHHHISEHLSPREITLKSSDMSVSSAFHPCSNSHHSACTIVLSLSQFSLHLCCQRCFSIPALPFFSP